MAFPPSKKQTVTKFILIFDPATSAYWLALEGVEKGEHVGVAVACDPDVTPPEEIEREARRILKLGRAKITWTRRVKPPPPPVDLEGGAAPVDVVPPIPFYDGWDAIIKR